MSYFLQQNKTILPQAPPLTTLDQGTKWAYSTTLQAHTAMYVTDRQNNNQPNKTGLPTAGLIITVHIIRVQYAR